MFKAKFQRVLFSEIDPSIVSIFRILFGLFMLYQLGYYYSIEYAYQFMSGPEFLFSYEGLEFIKPMSLPILKGLNIGLIVSAVLITLGLFYRYAMAFFFIGFSYFTLIDKTLYNNHLYLIMLLAFVLIFVQADKKFSLKNLFRKKPMSITIPAWNQHLLAFLIALPYFYGGLAKLSPNWLSTSLVDEIISLSNSSFLADLLPQNILVGFFKYGGLVYDLGIVFLLIYKKTRLLGLVLVVIFNLSNHSVLFGDIGLFPFLMICSTVLFFDSKRVGSVVDSILTKIGLLKTKANKDLNIETNGYGPKYQKRAAILIGIFVVFQLLFPFRHHLLTNNPEWTGVASRFSWRMKLQSKKIAVFDLRLTNQDGTKNVPVNVKSFVSTNQYLHLVEDPFNIIALSKYLAAQAIQKGVIENPEVKADIQIIFNGKHIQPLCATDLDLTTISKSKINNDSWIKPLR